MTATTYVPYFDAVIEGAEKYTDLHDAFDVVEVNNSTQGDALEGLEALGVILAWAAAVEEELVIHATAEGRSWSAIGKALGRSKQTVWAKHHDPQELSPSD